jgi:hypothetical protein
LFDHSREEQILGFKPAAGFDQVGNEYCERDFRKGQSKNLSLYQPTRSAGRHGNLRRLKTWTRTIVFETQSWVGPHDRRASGRRV